MCQPLKLSNKRGARFDRSKFGAIFNRPKKVFRKQNLSAPIAGVIDMTTADASAGGAIDESDKNEWACPKCTNLNVPEDGNTKMCAVCCYKCPSPSSFNSSAQDTNKAADSIQGVSSCISTMSKMAALSTSEIDQIFAAWPYDDNGLPPSIDNAFRGWKKEVLKVINPALARLNDDPEVGYTTPVQGVNVNKILKCRLLTVNGVAPPNGITPSIVDLRSMLTAVGGASSAEPDVVRLDETMPGIVQESTTTALSRLPDFRLEEAGVKPDGRCLFHCFVGDAPLFESVQCALDERASDGDGEGDEEDVLALAKVCGIRVYVVALTAADVVRTSVYNPYVARSSRVVVLLHFPWGCNGSYHYERANFVKTTGVAHTSSIFNWTLFPQAGVLHAAKRLVLALDSNKKKLDEFITSKGDALYDIGPKEMAWMAVTVDKHTSPSEDYSCPHCHAPLTQCEFTREITGPHDTSCEDDHRKWIRETMVCGPVGNDVAADSVWKSLRKTLLDEGVALWVHTFLLDKAVPCLVFPRSEACLYHKVVPFRNNKGVHGATNPSRCQDAIRAREDTTRKRKRDDEQVSPTEDDGGTTETAKVSQSFVVEEWRMLLQNADDGTGGKDAQGSPVPYFYNLKTKQTSWSHPDPAVHKAEIAKYKEGDVMKKAAKGTGRASTTRGCTTRTWDQLSNGDIWLFPHKTSAETNLQYIEYRLAAAATATSVKLDLARASDHSSEVVLDMYRGIEACFRKHEHSDDYDPAGDTEVSVTPGFATFCGITIQQARTLPDAATGMNTVDL